MATAPVGQPNGSLRSIALAWSRRSASRDSRRYRRTHHALIVTVIPAEVVCNHATPQVGGERWRLRPEVSKTDGFVPSLSPGHAIPLHAPGAATEEHIQRN